MSADRTSSLTLARKTAKRRRMFAVELITVVLVGAGIGHFTGPFFIEASGVSLVALEDPEPVPGNWGNTALLTLGLFGVFVWPAFLAIPYFLIRRSHQRKWDKARTKIEQDQRAQRQAETSRRIAEAQAAGVIPRAGE